MINKKVRLTFRISLVMRRNRFYVFVWERTQQQFFPRAFAQPRGEEMLTPGNESKEQFQFVPWKAK